MKDFLDKGIEVSKSAFEKAGVAVQDFGDKSVTKIEIKKLESQLEQQYTQIGKAICDLYAQDSKLKIDSSNETLAPLLSQVQETKKEIEEKKSLLASESTQDDSSKDSQNTEN